MRQSTPRNAKPLTEVKLSCGHFVSFLHRPDMFDLVPCIKCGGAKYSRVVEITKFFGDCWNCDWYQPFTTEERARNEAEHHAISHGHRTKILGNNLEMAEFDYEHADTPSVAVEQLMLDSELTEQPER